MTGITTASSKQIFAAGTGSSCKGATPCYWWAINLAVTYTSLNIKFGLLLFQNSRRLSGCRTFFLRQNNPYFCEHYWFCLPELTSKLRKHVAFLQHSALNMFLLSRTGCELQRKGLFQWPSSGSMLGWESQRGDKVLENCSGTGSVDVTFQLLWCRRWGQDTGFRPGTCKCWFMAPAAGEESACFISKSPTLKQSYQLKCEYMPGKNSKSLLLNCRVGDYQLPWKCHTNKKNYVHHILLEEKLSPASYCTCVYPAQVWEIRLAPAHSSCLIGYNYWLPAI